MDGYKTMILGVAMLGGTFVLIIQGLLPATEWATTVIAVAALWGVREGVSKWQAGKVLANPSTRVEADK